MLRTFLSLVSHDRSATAWQFEFAAWDFGMQLSSVPLYGRLLLTLLTVAVVVVISTIPGTGSPGDSTFSWLLASTPRQVQKLLHVVFYAMLTFLCIWTLEGIRSTAWRFALALIMIVGLGIALEWSQTRIPGRFGSAMDVVLNTGGAIVGLIAALLLL